MSNLKQTLLNICSPLYILIRYGAVGPMYKWPLKKLVRYDLIQYRKHTGKKCNFDNPVTFNEKLQRYNFFYKHPDVHRITDKATFKQYIAEKIGPQYVVPAYGIWDNIDDLEREWYKPDSVIPEEFMLKGNLQADDDSMMAIHKKSETDFQKIKPELEKWLKIEHTLMNSRGRNIYWGKPVIIAEKFLRDAIGSERLSDWKIFCFDGEPYCIYVDAFHGITFFDLEWNRMDVKLGPYPNVGQELKKPEHFSEMIDISRTLSKEFPFVRVDFYETGDRLYLGEMTFCPGGGFDVYHPESFDRLLGDKFHLPEECMTRRY